MTETLADKLAPYGIDYVDAMKRFEGNEALFERLALKYLNDTHFAGLVAALEVKDFDDAYNQAHSLKGVAGNLSLRALYEAATFESDALHAGEYEAAEKHLPQVEEAHKLAVKGLEALRDGTL
ncbi:Hpt domain-containing protein [Adlercreutzia faecimuris]|uniref:Hpt domain-containing protein n=1 Tax=Adlercreutzia faecimuris TaxID=2897341 RepID=A0ABS9WG11_9ACTN|nr:Hpt domain-containing protein [Adlercreutzia sp. JBNU-10]MCI2241796.1 Hpt domain-containing protein [Adlercreutzia sp. JBNU-10]